MLNNREHAEHLAIYIDRLRENGTPISSRAKGYWLDLLQYRNDQTGRCDTGQRELKAKTGHGHATLRKMDKQAEELGLYRVEHYQDEQTRQRLRFNWNPWALEFDNDGQPTRVTARPDRAQPDTNRAQPSTKNTPIPKEDLEGEEEQGQGDLRAHLSTADEETRPTHSRRFSDLRDEPPAGRRRQWDILEKIAEIERQERECKPQEVMRRYELKKTKLKLESELAAAQHSVIG